MVGDALQSEHDCHLYHDMMKNFEFNKAMDEVWLMIRSLNQYLEDVKPWAVAKARETDPEAEAHLGEILGHCVGTLNQIADLLYPMLPTAATAIKKQFEGGVVRQTTGVLFPKIYNHTADPRAAKLTASS